MKPLSVGNVVSAGLRIYRDNFKKYYKLAFIGYLWILLPAFILEIIGGIAVGFVDRGSAISGILVLLFVVAIVGLVYGCAKYYAIAGLISRLAYSEITEKPETVKDANRYVKGRMWSFLGAGLLVFLRLLLAYIGGAIILAIVLTALIFGLNLVLPQQIALLITIVLGIAGLVAFLSFLIRLLASFFVSELPLAMEDDMNATKALRRSQELTNGLFS